MALTLYAHPFSSFSQKALIALYENNTPFRFRMLNDAEGFAELAALWPHKKFPVLVDGDATVIEATIIIEHLAEHYPGPDLSCERDCQARKRLGGNVWQGPRHLPDEIDAFV